MSRILSLVLITAVLLSACGPSSAPAATAPPAAEPVVLRIGWGGTPDTLNPAYAFLEVSYRIFDLTYSSLVKEDLTGKYVGDLAKEWSHSDDGLTWTFTLRDGIQWHDGTPFTAEDMAWAINAILNDPEGWVALANYTNGFGKVEALDAKTVQITLDYPIANMEYRVSWLYAFPRKDFEPFETAEDLQNFANEKLLGTGAFKMNRFDKDKGIVILDANPDYYGGRPIIDQVIFQTFDNSDAMVQAIKVGDVDALYEVPNSAFETVKGFANVKTVQKPSRAFDELIINSVSPDLETNTGHPALRDPAVREAIAYAIDKQDIVDIVLQGLGGPAWSIVAPTLGGGFWYNSTIIDREFSLEKANQLLEDAGYAMGADGVRAKGDVRLEMRLQFDAGTPVYARIADLMSGWFKDIGLKVTTESVDTDTLIVATTGIGDFDLVIWGWGGGDPDPDFILSIMTTDQFVIGGWSDAGYSNAGYDQMYLDQQQTIDPAARQTIIWTMQEMLFQDLPYVVLYNSDRLQAYRTDRFKNFQEDLPNSALELSFVLQQVEPVK